MCEICRTVPGIIASMFDGSDVDLLEVMGEATRDESTSIALRLLAVGELFARRAVELVERGLWSKDPTDWVAAEISAVQNISHARAVGQVSYGRTLRERLPRWPGCSCAGRSICGWC